MGIVLAVAGLALRIQSQLQSQRGTQSLHMEAESHTRSGAAAGRCRWRDPPGLTLGFVPRVACAHVRRASSAASSRTRRRRPRRSCCAEVAPGECAAAAAVAVAARPGCVPERALINPLWLLDPGSDVWLDPRPATRPVARRNQQKLEFNLDQSMDLPTLVQRGRARGVCVCVKRGGGGGGGLPRLRPRREAMPNANLRETCNWYGCT